MRLQLGPVLRRCGRSNAIPVGPISDGLLVAPPNEVDASTSTQKANSTWLTCQIKVANAVEMSRKYAVLKIRAGFSCAHARGRASPCGLSRRCKTFARR